MSYKDGYKFAVNIIGTIFIWSITYIALLGGKISIESKGALVWLIEEIAKLLYKIPILI